VDEYKVKLHTPNVADTIGDLIVLKSENLEFEAGTQVVIHSLKKAPSDAKSI